VQCSAVQCWTGAAGVRGSWQGGVHAQCVVQQWVVQHMHSG
jgi:hypothetical protein